MTNEQKELVFRELCARTPYGVKFKCGKNDSQVYTAYEINVTNGVVKTRTVNCTSADIYMYLRSLDSMTDEEKTELKEMHLKDEKLFIDCIERSKKGDNSSRGKIIPHFAADWCREHHFDISLIKDGLALEAPEGMYANLIK